MFDTMTLTKIVGGFCGMFLVFLLGGWVAETVYHGGEGGHGDDHHQAYTIDTGEDDGHGEEVAEEVLDFATVFAAADAGKGEGLFRACRACHKLDDGANGTGPHLYAVVGRSVGSVDGFNYSGNLVKVADTWGLDELNGFLEDPKGYAPGTKMAYKGMDDIEDRANLIAYLESIGG
ncbi:MAG: cytochrome c family protein [Rhodobacter sp.]|nr:cytochrome c family protein [Rhodobacter sp.]